MILTHIGKSTGHSGSYSTNYQLAGRELLTQDEIRMLDNNKAILLIRGEKPIIDKKYNILIELFNKVKNVIKKVKVMIYINSHMFYN